MKKLHFSVVINASKEKVWDTMLPDATYREWTSVFNPGGSYYKGDWSEGSKMLFIGPDEKGALGGMVSMIDKNIPHEFLSIKHVGELRGDVEDTTSPSVLKWSGAFENYTFKEINGGTELGIDINVVEEFEGYMNDTWPAALEKLKGMCGR